MDKNKVIHICTDSVFSQHIVDLFEKVNSGANEYWQIYEGEDLVFPKHTAIEYLSKKEFKLKILTKKYFWMHSLYANNLWACSILKGKKIMWSSWGGDMVGNHNYYTGEYNLEPKTLFFFNNKHPKPVKIGAKQHIYKQLDKIPFLNKWYYYLRNGEHLRKFQWRYAYPNIDFVSTVLPNEKIFLDKLEGLQAQFLWFNYSYVRFLLGDSFGKNHELGTGVVVGHSAHETSNHLDAFEVLEENKITDPLYLPLAYGARMYVDYLKEVGIAKFGNQIHFLETPIPLDQYVDTIAKNHVFIFNSKKQEAIGNLITALYLGMKVFLNEKGMVYTFCKEHKLIVFSVQNDLSQNEIDLRLTKEEIDYNRQVLEDVWGEKVVEKRCLDILNQLCNG